MSLLIIRLLFDAGLVILIWIVQLVIYPSFQYYQKENLLDWHNHYTQRISYVVFPLMFGQLSLSALQLWNEISWYTILSLLIISLLWLSTFLQFVPLHHKISSNNFDEKTLANLEQNNWLRTFLWTGLFSISMLYILA